MYIRLPIYGDNLIFPFFQYNDNMLVINHSFLVDFL